MGRYRNTVSVNVDVELGEVLDESSIEDIIEHLGEDYILDNIDVTKLKAFAKTQTNMFIPETMGQEDKFKIFMEYLDTYSVEEFERRLK